MRTRYIIDPVDSLFFRDARPFSAGENAVAQQSLFPPAPHTVVGAIRAQWAAQQGWLGRGQWDSHKPGLLKDLGGDHQQLQGVAFAGPELVRLTDSGLERLYPAPAALIGKLSDNQGDAQGDEAPAIPLHLVRLRPSRQALHTDLGTVRLPQAAVADDDKVQGRKNLSDYYLTESGLQLFLRGGVPDQASHWYYNNTSCSASNGKSAGLNVSSTETRVGNQIDPKTGGVIDGMLYSTHHVRLANDIRLIMDVDTGDRPLTMPSYIALGGEGRAATLTSCEQPSHEQPSSKQPQSNKSSCIADQLELNTFTRGQYVVYVRTPILLAEAIPSEHRSSLSRHDSPLPHPSRPFAGLPGKVVSACLYPAQRYGEWIQEKGLRQSKTRSVIPAGSVIFMQAEQASHITELYAELAIGERTSWGYGCIAIGTWQ